MKTGHVRQKIDPRAAEKLASPVVLVTADEVEAGSLAETRDSSERCIAELGAMGAKRGQDLAGSLMPALGADGVDSGGSKAGAGDVGI